MSKMPFAFHDTFTNRLIWPEGIVTNSEGRMVPLFLDPPNSGLREAAGKLLTYIRLHASKQIPTGLQAALHASLYDVTLDGPEASHASRGTDDELVAAAMVAQSDKLALEEKVLGLEADVSRLHEQIRRLTRAGHTE